MLARRHGWRGDYRWSRSVPRFNGAWDMLREVAFEFDSRRSSLDSVKKGTASTVGSFTRATAATATYWKEGILNVAAVNQLRLEENYGAKKVLLLEPAATNKCQLSRTWTNSVIAAQNQVGIDGTADSAALLTDDSAASSELTSTTDWTSVIPNDSNPVAFSVFIKKDTTTTRFVGIFTRLTGGGVISGIYHLNTSTGAIAVESGATVAALAVVDSYGSWWRVLIVRNNDSSGNVTAQGIVYPARATSLGGAGNNAAVGTCIADGKQIELNTKVPTSFVPTAGAEATRATEAGTTSWAIPQTSLGAELVTNGTMEADSNWSDVNTPTVNERSTTQVYEGTYSRKYTADGAGDGIDSDAITTRTGSLYKYEGKVYPTITGSYFVFRKGDDSGNNVVSILMTANQWNVFSGYFVETAGGALAHARFSLTGAGTAYVDGVSLREVFTPFAEVLGAELVTNGTFDANITGWTNRASFEWDTFEWDAGGKLHAASDGSAAAYLYSGDNVAVVAGNTYKFSVTYTLTSGADINIATRQSGTSGTTYWSHTLAGSATYTFYHVATVTENVVVQIYQPLAVASDILIDNVSVKQVLNPVAGGPPQGTVVALLALGANEADITTQASLLGVESSGISLLGVSSGGDFTGSDAANTPAKDANIARKTMYKAVTKWGYLTSSVAKMNVGAAEEGTDFSSTSWGTVVAYDGSFAFGTTLTVARTVNATCGFFKFKRALIFNRVLNDAEINLLK